MNTIRRWSIYANYFDGERELLNQVPFIGDTIAVTEEASKLIANLDGVESVEYESLGTIQNGTGTLAAGAGGMITRKETK